MRINSTRIAIALLLALWGWHSPLKAQQTFTLASNLPPRLDAGIGVSVLQPGSIFSPFNIGANAFVNGGDGNYTYLWTPSTGLADPTVLNATVSTWSDTLLQSSFVLTVTDGNGCIVMDTVDIDFSLDAEDAVALGWEVVISPNPNNGQFTLKLKGEPSGMPVRLFVSDVFGRQVYVSETLSFNGRLDRSVDLTGVGAGMYFLGLESNGKQVVRPVIVR